MNLLLAKVQLFSQCLYGYGVKLIKSGRGCVVLCIFARNRVIFSTQFVMSRRIGQAADDAATLQPVPGILEEPADAGLEDGGDAESKIRAHVYYNLNVTLNIAVRPQRP